MKSLYFTLLFISFISFGQQNNTADTLIGCTKHVAISAKMKFDEDLKNNALTIFLQGGIVSVIKKADIDFAKNSGFRYHDFGCMAPDNISFYENYNIHVFNYISKNNGGKCRDKISKNAFGLKKWNES